jgi:hypothetical protein
VLLSTVRVCSRRDGIAVGIPERYGAVLGDTW